MTQPMFSLGDKVTGWKDDRTGMVVGNVTAIGEYEGIHQYHIALDSGEKGWHLIFDEDELSDYPIDRIELAEILDLIAVL